MMTTAGFGTTNFYWSTLSISLQQITLNCHCSCLLFQPIASIELVQDFDACNSLIKQFYNYLVLVLLITRVLSPLDCCMVTVFKISFINSFSDTFMKIKIMISKKRVKKHSTLMLNFSCYILSTHIFGLVASPKNLNFTTPLHVEKYLFII